MIIFFTSGTVSYPKMVRQPVSYGLGHATTARFWHDLRPRRPALDRLRHRLGEGGLGRALRPVARARDGGPGGARQARRRHRPRDRLEGRDHLVLRPADALPPDRPGGLLEARPLEAAPLHQRRRAAQPGGDPRLGRRHRRADGVRRLRPVGDGGDGRQLPLPAGAARARWASRCPAGTSTSSTTRGSAASTTWSATSPSDSTAPAPSASSTSTSATTTRTPSPSATASTTPATKPGATATVTSGSRAATTT